MPQFFRSCLLLLSTALLVPSLLLWGLRQQPAETSVLVAYTVRHPQSNRPDIGVMHLDGSAPRVLTVGLPGGSSQPRWSPDGRWISFLHYTEGRPGLYLVRPNGQALRRLSPHHAVNEHLFDWSPDGRWLLFGLRRSNLAPQVVYRIRPDGTQMQELLRLERWVHDIRWSPDGRWLLVQDEDYSGLRLYHPDGQPLPLPVPAAQDLGYFYRWGAGDTLYFAGRNGDKAALYSVGIDGAAPQVQFPLPEAGWRLLSVSPDGATLLLRSPTYTFALLGRDGQLRLIQPRPGSTPIAMQWAADGRWLLYQAIVRSAQGNEVHALYRMRPDGSEQERLTPPPLEYYGASPSPPIDLPFRPLPLLAAAAGLALLLGLSLRRGDVCRGGF